MEKYKVVGELGSGSYGCVTKAINKESGEVVAIKRLNQKFRSWEECLNLIEVKSLLKMNHPNIIKLNEVIRQNCLLYFVFEYMQCNLYEFIKGRNEALLPEDEIRNLCFQVFQGLAHMHQNGYFHRDLKPENLLIRENCVKIADFGMAKEIGSRAPYSHNVSTLWYKAPEVMLRSPVYSAKIDMWAMGAIIAELFTQRPLFAGDNEADQMYKICGVLGSPSMESWADGIDLARNICYEFPKSSGVHLSLLIPNASPDAVNLIRSLCSWDPIKRPTAAEALQRPFFSSCFYIPPSLCFQDHTIWQSLHPILQRSEQDMEKNCSVAYEQPFREYKLFV